MHFDVKLRARAVQMRREMVQTCATSPDMVVT